LVDVEGGNNMLYLPLDKLMGQRNEVSGSAPGVDVNISDIADEVIKKLRSDQATTRRRETR
jgi:membrane protease subunit HflK